MSSGGFGRLPVVISIIVALLLTLMPLPDSVAAFRPDFVVLVLVYWAMMLPRTARSRPQSQFLV